MTKDAADCKDTERLIERLRRYSYQQAGRRTVQGELITELVGDMHDAADALEAMQEKQSMTRESLQHHMKMCRDYEARIAELEEQLLGVGSIHLEARVAELQKENEKLVDIVEIHMGGIEVLQKGVAELESALRDAHSLCKHGYPNCCNQRG